MFHLDSSRARSRLTLRAALAAAVLSLTAARDASTDGAVAIRGRWVFDACGRAVGPGPFRRGLQTSALVARGDELWSAGDQRSEHPNHLFRIDPRTARLVGEPLKLLLPEPADGESPHFAAYRSIPNSDFEALAADPRDPRRLFAATEDKTPWIAAIRLERGQEDATWRAWITHLAEIRFPADLAPWRYDSNFRVEGIALCDGGKTIYLAFERAADGLPRILELPAEAALRDLVVAPEDSKIRFRDVPRRPDMEEAELNVNDIHFIRLEGRPSLLALARDQERILVIDLESKAATRWIDLDLRDPDGQAIHWVSPEGIAADPARDRLWIINDPDSMRGNYRLRGDETSSGPCADLVPLLFEGKLSRILGRAEVPPAGGAPAVGRQP
ncbi:MAG: hypothetical protein JXA90_08725 [Planctomycetes bacterium]|nr:hypothetical protein [Planctomycetota bacterium]